MNKTRLFKGLFWIVDGGREEYFFRIPCNTFGEITGETDYSLNSKDGTNYNHKLLWAELPKSITGNEPFDYYPRGRVEIKNAKATVYLNPDINIDDIRERIIAFFGLLRDNGIISVRFVSDGSSHYKYIL